MQEEEDGLIGTAGIGGVARQMEVLQGVRDGFGRGEQEVGVIRFAGGSGRQ